jgi:hypothetical protein
MWNQFQNPLVKSQNTKLNTTNTHIHEVTFLFIVSKTRKK